MTSTIVTARSSSAATTGRPPAWLFAATAALALLILVMAVAETNLWLHYLIDGGEYVSLAGLGFIAVAAVVLRRQGRVVASLPLVCPWLLFPVITQGDQIIDHLSINPMRAICHVLLGAIFAFPVSVVVLAARHALPSPRPRSGALMLFPGLRPLTEGRLREGTAFLATALLVLEMWVAVQYLGLLMIATLIVMILAVLCYGSLAMPRDAAAGSNRRARSERFAFWLVIAGVVASFALFEAYKNRPGAYQGSPSFLMDPQQQGSGFRLDRVAVPQGDAQVPAAHAAALQAAFTGYGQTLQRMLDGYHILDRNYTYDFHNELFLRHTPLLPAYRVAGLQKIDEARALRAAADGQAQIARAQLGDDNPVAALLDDVRDYVAFNFERAGTLERMSAEFEATKAGLQHAAHIYEGEGKVLGMVLADLMTKHQAALDAPAAAGAVRTFRGDAQAIYQAYADRIVGF